jgi:DNA-binding response OmpR family regulator
VFLVLADKDPYDLQALQAGLAAPGREVLIVEDGPNVITLAESRDIDVVVVGQSLGHMGGFAVSRELKQLAENGAIRAPKVIILLERAADAWLANWSRCDGYLLKPIDVAELDTLVEELAGQRV